MGRFAALILIPLLLSLGMPAAAVASPVLKPAATVTGPVIHLGDIFAGVGDRASIEIAEAPPPGSRMTFSSAWLTALARSQHLAWEPTSGFDQVTVERASRVVGAEEIADQLKQALADRAPLDDAEVRFDRGDLRLVVAAEAPTALTVASISYDPASGRFAASVTTPDGASVPQQLRVTGQLVRFTEVPTPVRLIAPGETIANNDLAMVRLRNDRLGPGAVTQLADLVGKSARRALRPGETVHYGDVEVPVVVHRNSIVTIVLETPNMRLTAEGKAQEDGGIGAVIRVANTRSSRIIEAVVTGPNSVRVDKPS
ncbi:MAG TPA: flagellar basal body P-ring formation chaperone FlgA [Stellaceae bacterium]|nr:flagellar basal body P-ring formation chaperone FlgA [Stellaceae bacterium]